MNTLDPAVAALRARRLELGLTQDQLARRLGVTNGAVSKLELGAGGSPLLATLRRWADALGLELYWAPKLDQRGYRGGADRDIPSRHGSIAGAQRHYVRGEKLCGPCLAARRDYDRERMRAVRARRRADETPPVRPVHDRPSVAQRCPAHLQHTPGQPTGQAAWAAWAEDMARTHTQTRCPACRQWAIWVPREDS